MFQFIAVPNNPLEGMLRVLSQLMCSISAGGQGCMTIQ
ncbi:hypothetical protein DFR76_104681 [Nocardia pseudobrasiliensis]|uniref:Uncharacterized protein n=1 Tax=Nocardia pseudobrasiliensis TaxID=45979 RepID=A0A370I8A8_9NOCA|nr:hypothetical protein DFR76_104681 [Nocardia pseudobrasiliensis]